MVTSIIIIIVVRCNQVFTFIFFLRTNDKLNSTLSWSELMDIFMFPAHHIFYVGSAVICSISEQIIIYTIIWSCNNNTFCEEQEDRHSDAGVDDLNFCQLALHCKGLVIHNGMMLHNPQRYLRDKRVFLCIFLEIQWGIWWYTKNSRNVAGWLHVVSMKLAVWVPADAEQEHAWCSVVAHYSNVQVCQDTSSHKRNDTYYG